MALQLTACGVQRIRSDAEAQAAAQHYDVALKTLDAGLKEYPRDAELLTARRSMQEAAISKLLGDTQRAREAGRASDAAGLVDRALAIDPYNDRARNLQLSLARDEERGRALEQANKFVEQEQGAEAVAVLRKALVQTPRDAELLAALRQIEITARRAGAVEPRIAESRPVSLEFRDANLRMVLEAISRDAKVNFVLDKDIRPDLRVTVFLRNTPLPDALDLICSTNQLSRKVLDSNTVLIYPNTPDKNREHQELTVRSFFLASADVKQTALLLKQMLKVREPFVDERLNLIVLRETPELIELAERLIAVYDQPDAEVMLEVEVLEVRRGRLTELGIKFPDSFSLSPLAAAGRTGLTLQDARDITSERIGLGVSGLLINLKREVGDTKVLANPRIRAKNREKARILVGDKLPIITSTATATGFVSESIQYIDVGTKVEFEPVISVDDEVTIKISLEASSLTNEVRTSSGSLAYQIGTRTASTTLKLKDGETQVLGGLIGDQDRSSSSRVPGLGDLPGLGRAFSSQRDDTQRTELVLAITPRIVRNVQRPDERNAEFFSGSEAFARSKPLRLSGAKSSGPAPEIAGAAVLPLGPIATAGPTAASAAAPALAVEPIVLKLEVPEQAKRGDVVEVMVRVSSQVELRGLPVEVAFDRSKLAFASAAAGDWPKQGGVEVNFSHVVNESAGKVSVGMLRNGKPVSGGEGTLVKLSFKAIAEGQASVRLVGATPLGADRVLAPPRLPSGRTVSIQ